ncbi:MAG: alpha/beta hydrolase, partial [Paracoccaceae bacterium]
GMMPGCSRAPELIGIDNAETPADSVPGVSRHRIFIATTREASEVVGALFSGERARELGLASVDVTVPPNHVVGELERPKRLPPDPRTEFAVVDPIIYRTDGSFVAQINRELAKRPPAERKVLLYVHGYNTSTSDAILRLSQFVEDSGYQGVPILFTWASAAKLPRYVYDLNSALVARGQLAPLADILASTQATDLDIFAHSMGTFLTMEGLVDAAQEGRLGTRKSIEHIVLASPDIDIDLFRTQVAQLPRPVVERIYLLVSADDAALGLSRRIAGGVPRVGAADTAELEGLGLTVIDLSEIDDSSSGSHSKFAGSPGVVKLIGKGLNSAGRFGETETPALGRLLRGLPITILVQ